MEEAERAFQRGADPMVGGEYRTQDMLAADFRAFVESVRAAERERVLDVVEDLADLDDPRVGIRLARDVRETLARKEAPGA
jgi:hypothetical protein